MLIPLPVSERFLPPQFRIGVAREAWELAGCFALRRKVFCAEQAIFEAHDRDDIDAHATLLAAVGQLAGMADGVVGTVRIHQAAPQRWVGSRLAVQAEYRRIGGLGTGLIRMAVGTARARGCTAFHAHVQQANVALFRSLHWTSLETVMLHGRPHDLMRADLDRYPAIAAGDLSVMLRVAA